MIDMLRRFVRRNTEQISQTRNDLFPNRFPRGFTNTVCRATILQIITGREESVMPPNSGAQLLSQGFIHVEQIRKFFGGHSAVRTITSFDSWRPWPETGVH